MVLAQIVQKIEREPGKAARIPHILAILRDELARAESELLHPAGSARKGPL